ncbi:MAG: carbohydrate ABC transporter permease [Bacillota bacterium]
MQNVMRSAKRSKQLSRFVIYLILISAASICIVPFIWMVLTSFKTNAEALRFPPTIFPAKWIFTNFSKGLSKADFGRFTLNTLYLATTCTVGTVISAALVAYGFSHFKARGSKIWFTLLMSTLMLPAQVTLVPQYLIYFRMGMLDTYWPMIIPAWLGGGAFNIFLYHQFFKSLPKELNEAAEIDGANSFQTFTLIMLPSVNAVMICVGVMSLVYNWNDFLTPLIYLNTSQKYTLAIGLQFLNSDQGTSKIGMMMAVALVTMMPVLILFFLMQKYFVQGIKISGIKG